MKTTPNLDQKNALSREAIVRALFERYESLYDIDAETSAYQCYYESDAFQSLKIKDSGPDFFEAVDLYTPKTVFVDDQEYVHEMLSKKAVLAALKKEKYYSIVYRLMVEGKPVYHKLRATKEMVDGRPHILIGVRNVEETILQENAHADALAAMYQKQKAHMAAVLASASGYLDANLTRDRVLEWSPGFLGESGVPEIRKALLQEPLCYSELQKKICDYLVVEGTERYQLINEREYLIRCFNQGERRASVSFSVRTPLGGMKPCRTLIFLYKDDASSDIFAFVVIYDLTEQQRKDKELKELENELRMSRIRNFTSQMQPHFLYNALGSIQEIMLDDPQYASDLIGDFTIHLRSCIRAMANDAPLPFEQELSNIKAYVNIEKMRFGKKLKVEYEIGATDFFILPLSIQPLVENAIRHGVYERGAQGGTVTVRTEEQPNARVITVEDNGVGFDVAAYRERLAAGKQDSTGLKNITFRLDKVMHAKVDVQSTVGVGTKVTVTIPKGGNKK